MDTIEDILPKDRENDLVFFVNGKKVSKTLFVNRHIPANKIINREIS